MRNEEIRFGNRERESGAEETDRLLTFIVRVLKRERERCIENSRTREMRL